MRTLAIKFTDEMRERLISLHTNSGYSHQDVFAVTGIKISTFKNLLRTNGTKSISETNLYRLSDFYDVTTQYLTCKTDIAKPDTETNDNQVPQRAISFTPRNQMIIDINTFLNENNSHLKSIHFLLCELPQKQREDFLKGLDSLMQFTREKYLRCDDMNYSPEKIRQAMSLLEFGSINSTPDNPSTTNPS